MRQEDHDHRHNAATKRDAFIDSGVACPFCASRDVELISLFGGQLSTDQYYCRACRSYFERFGRDDEHVKEDAGSASHLRHDTNQEMSQMTDPSSTRASTQVTQLIKAPRQAVYHAFLDRNAVATWQHPDNMGIQVHTFDPREGGAFRISLTYEDLAHSPGGKTSDDTDTYHGRFVRLVPFTTIVEVIEFESRKTGFTGEMRITAQLADVDGGTEVTYRCENIPPGVRPEDNEAGCRSSLQRLAALLEGSLVEHRPSDGGA
jgi:uncharacterized protein YndB with AHSA1/START domain